MSFSTAEVLELFEEETSREQARDDATAQTFGYLYRSGRHEGHDIPPLPHEIACVSCRRTFGTSAGLRMHLLHHCGATAPRPYCGPQVRRGR